MICLCKINGEKKQAWHLAHTTAVLILLYCFFFCILKSYIYSACFGDNDSMHEHTSQCLASASLFCTLTKIVGGTATGHSNWVRTINGSSLLLYTFPSVWYIKLVFSHRNLILRANIMFWLLSLLKHVGTFYRTAPSKVKCLHTLSSEIEKKAHTAYAHTLQIPHVSGQEPS